MTQEDGTIIRWLKESGESGGKGRADPGGADRQGRPWRWKRRRRHPYDLRFGPDAVVPVTTLIAQIAVAGESIAESTHKG